MVQSAFSCSLLICFSDGPGSILCRSLHVRMQCLKKFNQCSCLCRIQILSISRHIPATLDDLANQFIRRETDSNLAECRSALAAFAAEGMAVVTLFGLKNESALVLQRSSILEVFAGDRLAAPRVHYRTPRRVLSQMRQSPKRYSRHQDHQNGNWPAFPTLLAFTGKEREQQKDGNSN